MSDDEFDDEVWLEALGDSPVLDFTKRVFRPRHAMMKKTPEEGHRVWTEYDPVKFSKDEYDFVSEMWDHEHCAICDATIWDGDTYWENSQNGILCPNCYAKFELRS